MKRVLALLLASLMVLSLFSACSKKSEGGNESAADTEKEETSKADEGAEEEGGEAAPAADGDVIDHGLMTANGEFPIVNDKMEFTVNCRQVSNVPDMMTNAFVLWLEDRTNIHMNYEMTPEDSITEKTNLILASGEYPDAFQYSAINTVLQVKYGSQGAFYNLAPYFEKFGYYSTQAYEATEYLPKAITCPDGSIYCIAGVNECYHCFHAGRAWINQLWMDDLGLETPNTIDELKTVLEAFRDNDCNGNGDATDEIPMIGGKYGDGSAWNAFVANWILESYHYDDYNMEVAIRDGHVNYEATTDEYKEGVQLIHDWVAEGLIDEEFMSIAGDELESIGMQDDARIGLLIAALWWSGVGNKQVTDPNGLYRERNYKALSNVEGPHGVRNTLSDAEGVGGNLVITTQCEYPEVMFRWADAQFEQEASIRAYAGSFEGILSQPDEGAVGVDPDAPALYKIKGGNSYTSEDTNEACDNVAIANKSAAVRLGQQTDWDDPEAYWDTEVRLYKDTHDYYVMYDAFDQRVPTLVMDENDSNLRSEMETPIRDYQREWLSFFALGQKDVEADWEEYVSGFDGLRLTEYIELLDKYYQIEYVNAE